MQTIENNLGLLSSVLKQVIENSLKKQLRDKAHEMLEPLLEDLVKSFKSIIKYNYRFDTDKVEFIINGRLIEGNTKDG